MADRCYCCSCAGSMREDSVVLRGVGRDVDLEEVKLFLESSRFCPIGGDVEDIERISEDSALVTFSDSQVATRLIGNSLTMPDSTELRVLSTQTIKHQQSDPCVDYNETDSGKDKSNGRTRKSSSGSSGSKSYEGSEEDDSTGSTKETISVTRTNRGNEGNGVQQITKSAREETRRNKGQDDRKNCNRPERNTNNNHNNSKDFKEKQDAETQVQFSDFPTNHTEVEEISFSLEKLKLIQLVLDFMPEPFSNVKFDENNQTITVHGTRDEIETIALQLYEIANNALHDTIHIPEQSEDIVLSARVESWLSEEFSNRQLLAVCCNIGDRSSILAKDEETLKSACDLLGDILVTEKLDFDGNEQAYLRTLGWTDYVEEAESSRIVSITTDESSSVVMVTGYASDVPDCVEEVRELLRANASTTHDMRCERRVVCLLKNQANTIMAEISQVASSPVQLDFDAQEGLIKLSGLESDLNEAVKLLDENFISAVRHERYDVNIPGLTIEMFTNKPSAGCDLVDLLELKYSCAIEVREQSGRHEEEFESQHRRRRDAIQVIQGDIVKFQLADILVNAVAKKENNSVMRCFLRAGGDQLEQELKRIGMPSNFGGDVIVTPAYEELKAKFIFHAAIGNCRNEESTDRLYRLIRNCLEMAVKHEAKSIAFPTLGCGRLGFRSSQVVACFLKAIKKSHSDLVIFVIARGDEIARKFRSHITGASSSRFGDDSRGKVTSGRERGGSDGRKHVTASDAIAFHISALSDDVIREVKEALGKRIIDLTSETPIHDKAIAKLSDEAVSSIRKLQSSHVSIEIDKEKKTITVKGEKSAASEARLKICSIMYKDWAKHNACRNDMDRVPEYWSKYKSLRPVRHGSKYACVRLSSRSVWYKEVSRLVTKTWEDHKVGKGSDAAGLGPHRVRIRNIFCIENPRLYIRYMTQRQLAANRNPCPKINGLLNERGVKTSNLKLRKLEATLSKNVNECFLLHGTKEDIVDSIQAEGLDSRLSGSDAMFGAGVYFTESSTKADQYADSKKQRVPDGNSMYMYVCRVLLGSPFICQTPKQFRRPPCKKRGCLNDACTEHKNVGLFDSVIGTHKSGNVRLLFREFIIYHPDQSYPDFLVEYERKSV